MRGSGALMFAVWPYVIAHQKPNKDRTYFTVELNSEIMAFLIGESQEDIAATIERCCQPDPRSRTPDEEGRKLIKIGTFQYHVVNGSFYDQLRREAELRESNRRRQEKFYQKHKEKPESSTRNNANADESGCKCDSAAIYAQYPRKLGKPKALAKISKAIDEFGADKVMEATKLFAAAWAGEKDLTFCPHPARWYGEHRFNDDPSTWARNENKKMPESNQIQEVIDVPSI